MVTMGQAGPLPMQKKRNTAGWDRTFCFLSIKPPSKSLWDSVVCTPMSKAKGWRSNLGKSVRLKMQKHCQSCGTFPELRGLCSKPVTLSRTK